MANQEYTNWSYSRSDFVIEQFVRKVIRGGEPAKFHVLLVEKNGEKFLRVDTETDYLDNRICKVIWAGDVISRAEKPTSFLLHCAPPIPIRRAR